MGIVFCQISPHPLARTRAINAIISIMETITPKFEKAPDKRKRAKRYTRTDGIVRDNGKGGTTVYYASPRQKLAAKIRHEQPTITDKEVLRRAGYDESTAEVSTLVTQSVGYKAELAKYGLTEELITSSLVEDIRAKPQKRVRELELGADILSMRKRPVEPNQTLNIAIFSSEQQERIAQRIIENLTPKP